MTRTVVALYDDFDAANNAVKELVDNGFSRDDISLMFNDAAGEYGRSMETRDMGTSGAAEGAGVGAGIGAAIGGLGGLLIGLGALTIPGIGPVVAAGPLAAALTGLAGAGAGAVAGGVTGGLIGALVDMGVPEETAGYYAEGVRRGGHLVTVRTPDHLSDRAVNILNRHNPVDVNDRVTQWRDTGWTGFDVSGQPYAAPAEDWERAGYRSTDMTTDYGNFDDYDTRFRDHFATSMYGTTYTYEQYRPAYRYGYDLATDERFRDRDWNDVEMEAHRRWDERNPGTWEEFKEAIRHAYLEIKDALD